MPAATLRPGFTDPVRSSQATFRAVLEALSRPGTIVPLPELPPAPAPLYATTGAIALALADLDAPVSLDAALATDEIAGWLRFHAGCPIVAPAEAAFALIGDAAALSDFDGFALGSPEFPDRSTTLVVQVPALRAEGLRLSGPGIRDTATLGVDGLSDGFWRAWADNALLFPQGIDVVFASPDAVCGLPRTTRVEV